MRTLAIAALALASTLTGAAGQPAPTAVTASTLYFAVVNSNGVKARSTTGVKSARLNTGEYRVIFRANVSKCAHSATVGSPTTAQTQGGSARTASLAGNPRGVHVRIGQQGGAVDRPFHLIVLCP
jgi:hypothetical protein